MSPSLATQPTKSVKDLLHSLPSVSVVIHTLSTEITVHTTLCIASAWLAYGAWLAYVSNVVMTSKHSIQRNVL